MNSGDDSTYGPDTLDPRTFRAPLMGMSYRQHARHVLDYYTELDWREEMPAAQEWRRLAEMDTFDPGAAGALLARFEDGECHGTMWAQFGYYVKDWAESRAAMEALSREIEGQGHPEAARRMLRYYETYFPRSTGHPGLAVARRWHDLCEAGAIPPGDAEALVAMMRDTEWKWNGWDEPVWRELRDRVRAWAETVSP